MIRQLKNRARHRAYRVCERDFVSNIEDIFSAMDQPTTDGINTYFISRCAREEGLKAVLSRLGGDELFGGYPSFYRIDRVWFLSRGRPTLKKILDDFRNNRLHWSGFWSLVVLGRQCES